MKRREKIAWLAIGAIYLVGFLCLVPAHYKICEIAERAQNENCPVYQLVPFVFIKLGRVLDAAGSAITALATIAIAWFTWSLRQSTDKLWDAGERQIALAREASGSQGRDMQASIAEAVRAATAMEHVAEGVAISAMTAQESVATLRERTAIQMRAYLTVLIHQGVYQERAKGLVFEVRPVLIKRTNPGSPGNLSRQGRRFPIPAARFRHPRSPRTYAA